MRWLLFNRLVRKNLQHQIRLVITLSVFLLRAGILGGQQPPLPGFSVHKFFPEQVREFYYPADVRIQINAPLTDSLDKRKETLLALFALPNGNSIEWTIGKALAPGDDWHYDIQHIGAQTRFLRRVLQDCNLVTVYLETSSQSWPLWRQAHTNNSALIIAIVDSLRNVFRDYNPQVILTGHSGGGSMTFGFLNGVSVIPAYVKRIAFLDSNYGYDPALGHGDKISAWLRASATNYLSVLAYNDSVALYMGEPVVSATGGTWYRSHIMQRRLAQDFTFTTEHDAEFERYFALNGRVQFRLKTNPTRAILHTVQVERNGFIQSILSGTPHEGVNYTYYGSRVYSDYIEGIPPLKPSGFGVKPGNATTLSLAIPADPNVAGYFAYLSRDGLTFYDTVTFAPANPVIPNLQTDSLYFVKIQGYNRWGTAEITELLAGIPTTRPATVLIVDGYDRVVTYNKRNFIRQHARAFLNQGCVFTTASNEMVATDQIDLNDFAVVDFLLGDERNLDETFSQAEQTRVAAYLKNGGRLFVSGSEIVWDLDSVGDDADALFCHDFLKMQYVANAPNSQTGIYYEVEFLPGTFFTPQANFFFDNGTHGTFNVSKPDAVRAVNGGREFLKFAGLEVEKGVAGVCYTGLFPEGTREGKLVALTFPFETVYPDSTRQRLLATVLDYFDRAVRIAAEPEPVAAHFAVQLSNLPNPFNQQTLIRYTLPESSYVTLAIYDLLGSLVMTIVAQNQAAGAYQLQWNGRDYAERDVASGIYYLHLQTERATVNRKLVYLR